MKENGAFNYLNVHVLISHSPSCLNRDDMNMQKSAFFGGVRRVRISSQSLKRAIRQSEYYHDNLGEPSTRTRDLARLKDKYADKLKERYDAALVSKVIDLIVKPKKSKDDKKGKKTADDGVTPSKESQAVAPWSVAEVAKICEIVEAAEKEKLDEDALVKKVKDAAKPIIETLSQNAFDVALSGRMATSGLMNSVDGAMAVAHVITTHEASAEVDWFAAVDDLTEEDSETGAGHLNTQEFGSGVFYRYASLNIAQLMENSGARERKDVLDKAAHLVHLLATVVPSAKQNSFAAHNPADLVFVTFSDIPLSYANAFEAPVRRAPAGGLIKPSIDALMNYVRNVYTGYGLAGKHAFYTLWDADFKPKLETLETLKDWVRRDGEPS